MTETLRTNALAAAQRIGAQATRSRLARLAEAIARTAETYGLTPQIALEPGRLRVLLPGGVAAEFGSARRPARPFIRTAIEQERAP